MKSVVVALVVLSLTGSAAAQDRPEPPRLSLGPVAGVAFIGLHGDSQLQAFGASLPVALTVGEGFVVGGFVELGLVHRIAIAAEVLFSYERSDGDVIIPDLEQMRQLGTLSVLYTRSSIEVPVYLAYRIPYDPRFIPKVFAGGYLAIPLSSEVSISGEALVPDGEGMLELVTVDTRADLDDAQTDLQAGVVIGASMGFPVGGSHLVAELRYHASVTHVIEAHSVPVESEPALGATLETGAQRDRGLVLLLGYRF